MTSTQPTITLHHNLDPEAFMWLWAKYVTVPNLDKHCTASLKSVTVRPKDGSRGSAYSQRFSKAANPHMKSTPDLQLDEAGSTPFTAIYLCGVSAAGYTQKKNYPHNLHAAIFPAVGKSDTYRFEDWSITIENGLFTKIPTLEELPSIYHHLPEAYQTCRIFLWAACILPQLMNQRTTSPDHFLLNS